MLVCGCEQLKESILGVEMERVSDTASVGSVAAFDPKSDQNTSVAVTAVSVWSRAWQITPLG